MGTPNVQPSLLNIKFQAHNPDWQKHLSFMSDFMETPIKEECLESSSDPVSILIEPRSEKTNILVSDLVRHKPGCTATEDS